MSCVRFALPRHGLLRYAALLGAVFLFCACTGSLLESKIPVPTTYVLAAAPPANDDSNSAAPLPVDLAIARPTTSPGLDTERIALVHEARRLDYYLGAQWGDALPQVVQSLIVASLQNQKMFRSVSSEQARVNAMYMLTLDIRDFQAEYASENAAPTIRVTLTGMLIRIKDRKLIASLPATATVNANANRLSAVVEAFESASQHVALSLGQQTAAAISANPAE